MKLKKRIRLISFTLSHNDFSKGEFTQDRADRLARRLFNHFQLRFTPILSVYCWEDLSNPFYGYLFICKMSDVDVQAIKQLNYDIDVINEDPKEEDYVNPSRFFFFTSMIFFFSLLPIRLIVDLVVNSKKFLEKSDRGNFSFSSIKFKII